MATVVFLHALPFDGSMWDGAAAGIAEPIDVLAPDLFTLGPRIEEWASAVLDMTTDDELVVVGNSVGGSCALEIAAAAPSRVSQLMLVGAKAGVRPEPDARDNAVQLLETEGMAAGWKTFWRPLFGPDAPADVLLAAEQNALSQDVATVVNGVRAFHDRTDRSDLAQRWTGPLMVVSGSHDTAPTPQVAQRSAGGPQAHIEVVNRCGHYVSLEAPRAFSVLLATVLGAMT